MKRKGILCFIQKGNKILLIKADYGDKVIWNGISGYVEEGESAEQAVLREVKEEIGVDLKESSLTFKGRRKVSDELELDIFTTSEWSGTPMPSEKGIVEVKWFDRNNIPFDQMYGENESWFHDLKI